jgi:hypothetical protein
MNIFKDLGLDKPSDALCDLKFTHQGRKYEYSAFYDRVTDMTDTDEFGELPEESGPVIRCPYCWADKFKIGYGVYACIAHCNCGHKMEVYGG